MKIIIVIFIACLSINTFNCMAQSGSTTYLDEQFNNNDNGWLSGDSSANTGLNLADGALSLEGTTSPVNTIIKRPIDDSRDFEIEISYIVLKRPGKHKNAGRLFWGYSDSLGGAWIGLSLDFFPFTYCRGGDHKEDKHKNIYAHPRPEIGAPVTLLIRKASDKYNILINGKPERKLPFEHLRGNELALEVRENSFIKVLALSIRYLN